MSLLPYSSLSLLFSPQKTNPIMHGHNHNRFRNKTKFLLPYQIMFTLTPHHTHRISLSEDNVKFIHLIHTSWICGNCHRFHVNVTLKSKSESINEICCDNGIAIRNWFFFSSSSRHTFENCDEKKDKKIKEKFLGVYCEIYGCWYRSLITSHDIFNFGAIMLNIFLFRVCFRPFYSQDELNLWLFSVLQIYSSSSSSGRMNGFKGGSGGIERERENQKS